MTIFNTEIDTKYSTLDSRKALAADNSTLHDFWNNSYLTIEMINKAIDQTDKNTMMSDEDKNNFISQCYNKRSDLYLNLAAVFGNIPL